MVGWIAAEMRECSAMELFGEYSWSDPLFAMGMDVLRTDREVSLVAAEDRDRFRTALCNALCCYALAVFESEPLFGG